MKPILIGLLFSAFCSLVNGQSVGDEVRYQCFCLGQEWVRATVERVDGGNVRVRYGNMDNQVVTLPISSPKLKIGNAARNPLESIPMDRIQRAFSDETNGKFLPSVQAFAPYYDSKYLGGGGGVPLSDQWKSNVADLAQLDSLCRTRYQGLTDWLSPGYVREGSVDFRFGVWCEIAANRIAIEKKARAIAVRAIVGMGYTTENLNFGFNEPGNPVRMEIQELIWNRAKWRAEKTIELKPRYAQFETPIPPDVFDEVEKRADELTAIVERDAPSRSWKQPPWSDAAVESFVKAKFASQYPGARVIKIGLDYRTWVQRKSLDYVASDSTFNYYKVSYNSYKRGSVLLKIPNRPFCQMQEWVVGKSGKGLVAAGIGGSGTFMKCE